MSLRICTNVFFSISLLASASEAQLMGGVLDAEWIYPDFGVVLEAHTVTVDQTVELTDPMIANGVGLSIDIGDDWVLFSFEFGATWQATNFNGWLFRDATGSLSPITGYSFDSASSGIGNTAAITTGFNENEFWANLVGITITGLDQWILFKVTSSGPGVPFCFGDGVQSACPCGNTGAPGEGCSNSSLSGAVMESTGSAQVSSNDLVLLTSQLPPGVPALFFSGTSAISPASLFGDGLRCAGGQITRLEVVFADANGDVSSSVNIASVLGATPGTQSILQTWYRDPTSLCGSDFNTSNALDLTWQ